MHTDRTVSTAKSRPQRPASTFAFVAGLLAVVATILVGAPAQAIMVGTVNGTIPDTSANPASTAGWTQGDPGYANAVRFGYRQPNGAIYYQTNGVYIGDGWVLTAWHVGVPTNIQFDSGATFDPVPNQDYAINNPTWNDSRLVNANPDLRLIRINGDPGLPSLAINTQALNINDQIMYVGSGVTRAANTSSFNVNKATNPWQWTATGSCSGSNCYQGFVANGNSKRWGTNRIANSDLVLVENDGNLQTIVGGSTIAYLTTYDQSSGDTYESLAVGGDSGSAVFTKKAGVWYLAGVMNSKYNFSGQSPELDSSNTMAIFGNANAFADLAAYNTPGNSMLAATMNAHTDYSIVGDIDLDGAAGTVADLNAFVAGWRYNNGAGAGTITSWKHGDVTHDGKTDLADFLRMRSGLSAGAGAQLTDMLGSALSSGGVPEPTTAILIIGPVIFFALRRPGRRTRIAA